MSDPSASAASAAPPSSAGSLEHSLRQVGKAVLRLNARLDALGKEGPARAPDGSGLGGACAAVADAVDAVERLRERAATLAAPPPTPPPRSWLARLLTPSPPPAAPQAEAQALVEGLALLRAQLDDALAREGLEPAPREGTFDPGLHQVVGTEPGAAPGEIVRVVRSGYRRGAQVVRPALVVVGATDEAGSRG